MVFCSTIVEKEEISGEFHKYSLAILVSFAANYCASQECSVFTAITKDEVI